MRAYLIPSEQKAADDYAISKIGVSGSILMENAASGSAHCIAMWLDASVIPSERPSILVLCGSGNNGGDGFAIARHLFCMNRFDVQIYHIGRTDGMSPETKANLASAEALNIPIAHIQQEGISSLAFDFDCIIDALLGTGSNAELYGMPHDVLKRMHEVHVYEKSLCIAIDIPTGIDAELGKAHHYAFKAHGTCTMFSEKVGMQLYPAKQHCGDVEIIMLGVPESTAQNHASVFSLEEQDIRNYIGRRKAQSHKYDYGRVLIIAGSRDMSGAPALCAMSAFRTGIGLVEIMTPIMHPSLPPEALLSLIPMDDDGGMNVDSLMNKVKESLSKTNAIVCGPGLGIRAGQSIMQSLLELNPSIPVILDADAIPSASIKLPSNWVITPHAGECARMTGIDRTELEQYPLSHITKISTSMECIVHLKSVPACSSNGKKTYITKTGNPGMATAGSGDILSGMIGALLARGINPLEATALSAMLHGEAGDFAQSVFGEESMSASDIIASIPHVMDRTLMDSWEDEA
ncbi:MAG: NAD(P)H-hydrate dehydratase [bacterium]